MVEKPILMSPSIREEIAGFLKTFGPVESTVAGKRSSYEAASVLTDRLGLSGAPQEEAVSALSPFINKLYNLKEVASVVFLESSTSDGRGSKAISIVVVTRSERSIEMVSSVEKAIAILDKDLGPIMPSGFIFVNDDRESRQPLEAEPKQLWDGDLKPSVLSRIVFERK